MWPIDCIEHKRDGKVLTKEEISRFITDYTAGRVADYQAAAWLMAVYFQGMTYEETKELTLAMAHSGDMVDLSSIPGIKVDKHSTGGIADTTTLIVAPLVAAAGVPVAKMSGRAWDSQAARQINWNPSPASTSSCRKNSSWNKCAASACPSSPSPAKSHRLISCSTPCATRRRR